MSWSAAAARLELRTLLSDGDTDKLAHRKQLFGIQDGVNVKFKSLEFRRVQTLVGATAPLGVYIGETLQTVSADDVATGELTLASPPANGDELRATYWYHWFTDLEIDFFILDGVRFATSAEDITAVPVGLRQSVIQYAAFDAYQKLAGRWAQKQSDVYRVEDSLKEDAPINPYLAMLKDCRKCAMDLRDDYYQNQGRNLNPAYASAFGRIPEVVPKR